MSANMTPRQREVLLDWIDEQTDPVTYDDVAQRFGVHYQTARTWMLILRDEQLIEQYPIKRGNKNTWVKTEPLEDGQDPVRSIIKRGPFKVARRNEHLDVATWVAGTLGNDFIQRIAYGLSYLYMRSYFASMPDQQHMRGTVPPAEVRTMILSWIDEATKDLEVARQLTTYKGVWFDGTELAERFGNLPVGGVQGFIKAGQYFHQQVTGVPREEEEPIPSPSPPEPQDMTLGDALKAMMPTGRIDTAAVEAEMQTQEPLQQMRAEQQGIQQEPQYGTLGDVLDFNQLESLQQNNPGLHIVEDKED